MGKLVHLSKERARRRTNPMKERSPLEFYLSDIYKKAKILSRREERTVFERMEQAHRNLLYRLLDYSREETGEKVGIAILNSYLRESLGETFKVEVEKGELSLEHPFRRLYELEDFLSKEIKGELFDFIYYKMDAKTGKSAEGQHKKMPRWCLRKAAGNFLEELKIGIVLIEEKSRKNPEEREYYSKRIEQLREASTLVSANLRTANTTFKQLVNSNIRFVISIAKRLCNDNSRLPDAIQEGNLGLLKAIDRFDYRLGYKLGTYAGWWIRQAITRYLNPVAMERFEKCDNAAAYLEGKLGREPTYEEISEVVEIPATVVQKYMEVYATFFKPHISLETEYDGGDGVKTMLKDILEGNAPDPTRNYDIEESREIILDMLQSIADERATDIVVRRRLRGKDGGKTETLEEIGNDHNICRERVRQIESDTLKELRRALLRNGELDIFI